MKRRPFAAAALIVLITMVGVGVTVYAHCQIPCGIYDDPARLQAISEHITTIEKSMNQIKALEGKDINQSVRWVMNKEKHADELAEIVTYYFMAQRIKPSDSGNTEAYTKYIRELTLLHQMLQTSMKAKQTTDLDQVAKLKDLLHDFSHSYLGETEDHTH